MSEHAQISWSARERLRDQQRQEASKVAAVLAAEKLLEAQRHRHAGQVAAADAALAARELAVTNAIGALVECSGIDRAAAILGRPASAIRRTVRGRENEPASGPAGGFDAGSAAPGSVS